MHRFARSILAAVFTLALVAAPLGSGHAASKSTKAPKLATRPKAVPRTLAGFCRATTAWTAWETATLDTAGHFNAKWITDTLAYVTPIYESAPKDIRLPVQYTIIDLMSSRRRLVESVVGKLDMPDAVESLVGTGETFATDTNFIANRDKFAAYSVAKCKVDWTAPFKAVAG
jgi:hypothetical protein